MGIDPSGESPLLDVVITLGALSALIAIQYFSASKAYSLARNLYMSAAPVTASPQIVPLLHKEMARLAYDVYNPMPGGYGDWRPVLGGISLLGLNTTDFISTSGFHAQLYVNQRNNSYALSFEGTSDFADVLTDAGQVLLDAREAQYSEAIKLARKVKAAIPASSSLMFTGHSLGGGLASAAASAVRVPAVTFNPSGLNILTLMSVTGDYHFHDDITAYIVNGEVLNGVQNLFGLPGAYGARVGLNPSPFDEDVSGGNLHRMAYVLRALGIYEYGIPD